ncbi:MAG: class I SAM-dependent methyltransferase [Verrucomicrobia bacterium]|nr:class I SAM-dependent methyltransferase [Verrucomicrobiota bacterium]
MSLRSGTLRPRLLAFALARFHGRYERLTAERKKALLGDLHGEVVEIGPGTGPNLTFYPADVRWIGIEPNPFMHAHLRAAAEKRGLSVEIRSGTAERIDASTQSVDAVVSTLVLCSVRDVAAVLEEARRVLKPGGRFVFLEHVAAPRGTMLRRVQRLGRPIVEFLGDGCHLDRETWVFIEQAGFTKLDLEFLRLPLALNGPHISGVAWK